jgi:hypothetical protein
MERLAIIINIFMFSLSPSRQMLHKNIKTGHDCLLSHHLSSTTKGFLLSMYNHINTNGRTHSTLPGEKQL